MENARQVKGIWIPIEIWQDKNLSWNEKILLLEIDSFTTQDKECYISNEYISELLGVCETTANKILSSLIDKGYVIKVSFDGRRRYVKSALHFTTRQGCTLEQGRLAQNGNILNTITNTIEKEDNKLSSKKKFDFKQALIDIGVEEAVAADWIEVRKTKKATQTQTAFNKIKNQIDICSASANECITLAVERSWAGFKAEWYEKEVPQEEKKLFTEVKHSDDWQTL